MTLPAENQQTVEAALDVLRAACEARFPEDHPWQMALDEIRAALRDFVAQADAAHFGDETVVHIDRFGVWTMRPGDDRPELRYVPAPARPDGAR